MFISLLLTEIYQITATSSSQELVLELLEDLLEQPHVWEAEAWLAGVTLEELLVEEIAARVGLVLPC